MSKSDKKDNFIEVETVDEANEVDLQEYSFIGIRDNKYCFKIRERKRNNEDQ